MSNYKNTGTIPKSPKLRHRMKREAEKQERKSSPALPFSSVKELFNSK